MNITKVFNNNVVATIADDNTEMVLTGSGIGFQKHIGDVIDEAKIEKSFIIDDRRRNQYYQMFQNTAIAYLYVSEDIFTYASQRMEKQLSNQMIIGLTDHISFAMERVKQGIVMPNLLLSEIKVLYHQEFEIAKWALDHIEAKLDVRLPVDEAGYIAMHIVNSIVGQSHDAIQNVLDFSKQVIAIIDNTFHVHPASDDLRYIRLTTHLKYLAQRIFNQEIEQSMDIDESMYYMLVNKHKDMLLCIQRIQQFVKKEYQYILSKQEITYVMIHISKII